MKKPHLFALAMTTALASTLLSGCATTSTTGTTTASTRASTRAKPYPLKTCIVTDTGLYAMGTPITKTYGDQQIKFCCHPCIAKYEQDPARYNAKL